MTPKKNPKADLARNSGLFFALALAVVLFLSWKTLEWKKYETVTSVDRVISVEDVPEELTPPVVKLKTPPPPPVVVPPDYVPEENETEKEESEVLPTDDVLDDPIIDVDDISVPDEVIPDEMVSIITVEKVPVFPGCEDAEDKLKCFEESMIRHIRKNFHYPDRAKDLGIQGKVYVTFIIDNDGNITGVKMRGPDKSLEEEAARIIGKLPKMTPGKQGNRSVRVPFSIPITFQLQ